MKSTNCKICDIIIDNAAHWKLHFCLFLLNPKYYQNEIGHILVYLITGIFNVSGSSSPFYDFKEMKM